MAASVRDAGRSATQTRKPAGLADLEAGPKIETKSDRSTLIVCDLEVVRALVGGRSGLAGLGGLLLVNQASDRWWRR